MQEILPAPERARAVMPRMRGPSREFPAFL